MRIIWLYFDLIIIMAWESSEYYRITELLYFSLSDISH